MGRLPPAFESIEVSILVLSPILASFRFSPEMSRKRRAKIPKMRNYLVGAISFIAVANFDAQGQAIAP
jgi:hypothetical protein